jgi:hypothetical protein
MAKRKRGRKSGILPRVPVSRNVPRLSKNFATREVLQALKQAMASFKTLSNSPRVRKMFQHIFSELDVNNQIREVVADYCADEAQQVTPKNFRARMRTFDRALETFLTKFPEPDDSLTEALDRELNILEHEAAPDTEYIRGGLDQLLEALKRLAIEEGGPGKDSNRAKHLLTRGLARIFEDHTGMKANSSFYIDQTYEGDRAVRGPFADFVKAVNQSIPDRYRLVGLETLFRSLG